MTFLFHVSAADYLGAPHSKQKLTAYSSSLGSPWGQQVRRYSQEEYKLISSRDEGDRYSRKYGALFLLSGTIADTIIIILHLAGSTSVCTKRIPTPSTCIMNIAS
jgi:hypothetical protein